MYFGWYPLSNASASCVIPRSSRNVKSARANARFSRYPRSSELPERAIGKRIVAHLSILFHKLYYPCKINTYYSGIREDGALGRV
jgi:hypothetical protein